MNGLITFAAAVVLAATASAENAPGSCEVRVGDWAIGGTCSVRRHGGGDWRLGSEALPSGTDGVAFVRVRLEANQPAKKPMFSVKVRLRGGEARSLWRPSCGFRRHDKACGRRGGEGDGAFAQAGGEGALHEG